MTMNIRYSGMPCSRIVPDHRFREIDEFASSVWKAGLLATLVAMIKTLRKLLATGRVHGWPASRNRKT
jgi:hypothetical protein